MRRLFSSAFAAVLVLTGAAVAQEAGLQRLDSLEDGREWQAVGRLDIGGSGFCTGALISPRLVLTAAHCLFDRQSGARIDHREIEFRAGWRNGRASAQRQIGRAVIHPDYNFSSAVDADRVRHDLALLELRWPIRNGAIPPFATGASPGRGAQVGVVSYARSRSEAPSLQEVCEVLARQQGVLVTTCSVDFGASGAPIFAWEADGVRIVSVVSAKAEANGRPVALGTSLSAQLDLLMDALAAGGLPLETAAPVAGGTARQAGGAKFVRP